MMRIVAGLVIAAVTLGAVPACSACDLVLTAHGQSLHHCCPSKTALAAPGGCKTRHRSNEFSSTYKVELNAGVAVAASAPISAPLARVADVHGFALVSPSPPLIYQLRI